MTVVRVYDWLRANKGMIETEGLSYSSIMEMIVKNLGSAVSQATITKLMKELGFQMQPPNRGGFYSNTKFRIVAQAVGRLYQDLGKTMPDDFRAILEEAQK